MVLQLPPKIWRRGGTNPMQYRPSLYLSASRWVYQDAAVQFTAADKSWLRIVDAEQVGLNPETDDFLICLWVWINTAASGNTILIKGLSTTGVGANGFSIEVAGSLGGVRFRIGDANPDLGNVSVSNAAAGIGKWHFVAAHADRDGNLSLSVDNTSVEAVDASSRTGIIAPINGPFALGVANRAGSFISDGTFFDGRIDSLMFFKKADLSPHANDIIAWAYNNGSGRLCAEITDEQKAAWGAVSGWEFAEASGQRKDSWGTNHLDEQFGDIVSPTVNNGGFETLGGNPFAQWTTNLAGSSTVNAETDLDHVHDGSTACRFDIDASNNLAQVYQQVTAGKTYAYSLYAKAATGTPTVAVTSGLVNRVHTLTTDYQLFDGSLLISNDGRLYVKRHSAPSNSIYIDNVTLRAAEILRAPGIVRAIAANGDGVSYWQDQSAGGKHAAQITLAKRPTLVTSGINSRPVIRGDGVDDYLGVSELSLEGAFAISAVFQCAAEPSAITLLGKDANNYITLTDNTTVTVGIAGASQAFTVSAMGTDPHILTVTRDADNAVNVYLDGTVSTTGARTVAGTLALEQVMANAGGYFAGDLAEVLVYDGAKTAGELARLHTHLARRYGITI